MFITSWSLLQCNDLRSLLSSFRCFKTIIKLFYDPHFHSRQIHTARLLVCDEGVFSSNFFALFKASMSKVSSDSAAFASCQVTCNVLPQSRMEIGLVKSSITRVPKRKHFEGTFVYDNSWSTFVFRVSRASTVDNIYCWSHFATCDNNKNYNNNIITHIGNYAIIKLYI